MSAEVVEEIVFTEVVNKVLRVLEMFRENMFNKFLN